MSDKQQECLEEKYHEILTGNGFDQEVNYCIKKQSSGDKQKELQKISNDVKKLTDQVDDTWQNVCKRDTCSKENDELIYKNLKETNALMAKLKKSLPKCPIIQDVLNDLNKLNACKDL